MHRLHSIEIYPETKIVILKTEYGYTMGSKIYDTMTELIAGVTRINALLLKNHPQLIKTS